MAYFPLKCPTNLIKPMDSYLAEFALTKYYALWCYRHKQTKISLVNKQTKVSLVNKQKFR